MRWLAFWSILVLSGCAGDVADPPLEDSPEDEDPAPYAVSGFVVDDEGEGVAAVSLEFESFGTATTALDGSWSKSGLEGTVTITPSRDGWGFSPGSIEVDADTSDITFTAAPLKTLLEIVVDWQAIGASSSNTTLVQPLTARAADDFEPTHVGARLEYPEENAFFAQSLTRVDAEDFGLITLDVPAAESTDLFVAAVKLNEEGEGQPGQRDPIVWFGDIRDLEIVEEATTTVRMEDLDWTEPAWRFDDDEVEAAYKSGRMVADKNALHLEFFISVRDPFGDRSWDEFIGLNGIGGATMDSEDGWWRVRVQCRNDRVGQAHESTCTFWPYLHSDKFNLPDVRFSVPPITTQFVVEWQ